jgi:ABC-type multidrug transport system fused ATPase/permease subunit
MIPVVAIVNKYYGTWLGRNAQKVQDSLAEANSVAQETFSCARTVIAFASEDLEYTKYVEKIDRQYQLNVRQTYMSGIYYMFVSTFLINTVVQGSLLLFGSHLIKQGKLTGEVLLAFMLYQGQLQNEMLNLFQSYSSLIKSSGAGDKVFGLLDRSPPSPGTGNSQVQQFEGQYPESENGTSLSIQLRDIVFSYPSRRDHEVLSGLNLTIGQGQTVALVGPSGCGKSTIVGLLQRFYDPTEGQILIDDVDIQHIDVKEHRRRIGFVTQDPTLFSGTILSNITYGTEATEEQAIYAAKRANAHDFISSFPEGYATEVGERGIQLSGGQKQRIAISRAIIRSPALLFLDEATSALDADSEEIVQEALDSLLTKNTGMTTVIIAHRLQTVRNADLIAVVNQGRIVEIGSHAVLMELSDGYYKGMVEKSRVERPVDTSK